MEYVKNLENLDMSLWKHVPDMKKQNMRYIILEFVNCLDDYFGVYKDEENNIYCDSKRALCFPLRRLRVTYVIPDSVTNTYNIQDLVASEIIREKYRVHSVKHVDDTYVVTLIVVWW